METKGSAIFEVDCSGFIWIKKSRSCGEEERVLDRFLMFDSKDLSFSGWSREFRMPNDVDQPSFDHDDAQASCIHEGFGCLFARSHCLTREIGSDGAYAYQSSMKDARDVFRSLLTITKRAFNIRRMAYSVARLKTSKHSLFRYDKQATGMLMSEHF